MRQRLLQVLLRRLEGGELLGELGLGHAQRLLAVGEARLLGVELRLALANRREQRVVVAAAGAAPRSRRRQRRRCPRPAPSRRRSGAAPPSAKKQQDDQPDAAQRRPAGRAPWLSGLRARARSAPRGCRPRCAAGSGVGLGAAQRVLDRRQRPRLRHLGRGRGGAAAPRRLGAGMRADAARRGASSRRPARAAGCGRAALGRAPGARRRGRRRRGPATGAAAISMRSWPAAPSALATSWRGPGGCRCEAARASSSVVRASSTCRVSVTIAPPRPVVERLQVPHPPRQHPAVAAGEERRRHQQAVHQEVHAGAP